MLCHTTTSHHHHHHHHHKVFARPFEVERSLSRLKPEPSGGWPWEAAFGQRHPRRRAQPRDVRSAGRDTWDLTAVRPSAAPESDHGDGAPARDRGAARPSGALTQVPSTARTLRSRRARPDTHTSAPYSAADASGSSCAAGARLR